MTKKYGFKPEHTTLLTNEQATLKKVKSALHTLRSQSTDNDHVLIYYAGHGDYEDEFEGKKEGGCWILHDGEGRNCNSRGLHANYLTPLLF